MPAARAAWVGAGEGELGRQGEAASLQYPPLEPTPRFADGSKQQATDPTPDEVWISGFSRMVRVESFDAWYELDDSEIAETGHSP